MKTNFSLSFFFFAFLLIVGCGFGYRANSPHYRQEEKPITMEAFNKRVSNKDKAVLVFFHADWCMICRKMEPSINEIEKELGGKLDVFRIDTERDREIADTFEVNSLPLLLFYKNGQKQWTHLGMADKNTLLTKIGGL
ncbi:MAG: thioredoxin domain-containing protein [Bacteroidota bacterium]|nr:thioredoxin domain-containing protein [Bacteroidota bacterium]